MRDERVLSRLRKHLYSANIAEARVNLKSYELFYEEHMSCYREIDLALDTFPYTGTTTTCEALWMGVPVLTLAGDRHAGRVGESILTRIGMEEFISRNPEDYVERAVRWASDLPRLAALRSGMRERMQASPLMDHRRMAQGLESAYRTAWEKYCSSMTP
jgi:predicted O-linked N-acetylglucosamine transferase (SPINDLY family)